jgi:type II secretory pathway pseudopilin PulG
MYRTTALPSKRFRRGLTLIEVLVIVAIIGVAIGLLLPIRRTAGGAARRTQCANNLKNIAVAVANYTATHGVLPPASTLDAEGHPLHGWRTLTLPHLDYEPLGRTIDLAKPWDDPTNALAREARPTFFGCPESTASKNETAYLATLDPGGCLIPGKPRRIADVTDGLANTLLVIEAGDDRAVPWMAPRDADESVLLGLSAAKLHHAGGTHAAFADGAVRFLKAKTPPPILRALATAAGGEVVSTDSY